MRPIFLPSTASPKGADLTVSQCLRCPVTDQDVKRRRVRSAALTGNSTGENIFPKTQVDDSEPAHNICFLGSSPTNRLAITAAHDGNKPERPDPSQLFRV